MDQPSAPDTNCRINVIIYFLALVVFLVDRHSAAPVKLVALKYFVRGGQTLQCMYVCL